MSDQGRHPRTRYRGEFHVPVRFPRFPLTSQNRGTPRGLGGHPNRFQSYERPNFSMPHFSQESPGDFVSGRNPNFSTPIHHNFSVPTPNFVRPTINSIQNSGISSIPPNIPLNPDIIVVNNGGANSVRSQQSAPVSNPSGFVSLRDEVPSPTNFTLRSEVRDVTTLPGLVSVRRRVSNEPVGNDAALSMLIQEMQNVQMGVAQLASNLPNLISDQVSKQLALNNVNSRSNVNSRTSTRHDSNSSTSRTSTRLGSNPSPSSSRASSPSMEESIPAEKIKRSKSSASLIPPDDGRLYGDIKFKDLPSFDGNIEKVHPVDFIENLELYYKVRRTSDSVKLVEVGRKITSKAADWYKVSKQSFNSFNQFKVEFLKYFWGDKVQKRVRATLFKPDQYKSNSGDFASYFLAQVKKVTNLDNPLPEPEIVSAILEHFPQQVQWAMIQPEPLDIKSALLKLQELDSINMRAKIPDQKNQTSSMTQSNQYSKPNANYNYNPNKNVKVHQTSAETENHSSPENQEQETNFQSSSNPLNH